MTDQKQGTVVTFGNLKRGTGKTTNSTMIAYALSEMGYKVLLCDQDTQANATSLYLKTKYVISGEICSFSKTLMTAIQDEDLGSIVTKIKENLYLLPSFSDFALYPVFLEKKFPNNIDRVQYFSKLIEPLKKEFDFIFIDVPPTISIITDSALYASNFVVVVLQTHEKSLQDAEVFTKYLQSLINQYGSNLDILGILPVLLRNGAGVDLSTLESAKKIFGEENLFNTLVKHMERLKRFDITGITDEDMHDKRVHDVFKKIAEEFISRLDEELEGVNAYPTHEFTLEILEEAHKEPEQNYSPKKEPMPEKQITSVRVSKSTRYDLNALVSLNKADTIDDLIAVIVEEYLDLHVTKNEKMQFDIVRELLRVKG